MALPEPLRSILPPAPTPRLPLLAAGIIGMIVLITLLAPILAPHDPLRVFGGQALAPPSERFPLGTDMLGRDVLSRVLWGGRQTLSTALLATAITIVPGLAVGMLAGFYGRWIDQLLMALMDILLAFPSLLFALALITLTGTGPAQVAIAVGIAGMPAYARITRTAVIDTRSRLYIEAARAVGVPQHRILGVHILPNIMNTLLNFGGVSLSWALLNSAALAFLGFIGDPSVPDWGVMLNEGRAVFRAAPWVALPPGLAITLTVYATNRLADARQQQAPDHQTA